MTPAFAFQAVCPQQSSRKILTCGIRGGRAGSQTRICSFGRCRVVRLHYPPVWNSRRESNPDLFVRTELGPKRHHALDHASLTNVEGCSELNSGLILLGKTAR